MAEPSLKDEWSLGDPYDTYIGRWSRLVAKRFLAWLALPSAQRWLDLGCGTGALTQMIVEEGAPASVVGVDPSEGFIVSAHSRVKDARARFQTGSAHAIPLNDAAVDAAVCGLVLNFTHDPAKAVAEMKRVVRPGGTVAAYVWDYAGDMQMIRLFWDAATALDPGAHALDEGRRFPICSSAALLKLWNESGLDQAVCCNLDVSTTFRNFEDYWSPFLGGQGPAPTYCAALTEQARAKLRGRLQAMVPVTPDGTIHLVARALAVRGVRP
jgi:SAM-dependent methyltransferase